MPVLRPKLEVPLSSTQLPAPIMFRSAYVPPEVPETMELTLSGTSGEKFTVPASARYH